MPTSPVIQKNKLAVEIYTSNLRIAGKCHLPIEAYRGRLTDLLNEMGYNFIPVTDAKIYDRDSNKLIKNQECIVIGKNFIEAVLPAE